MANIQTDVFVVDKNGTPNVLWVVQAGAWGGPLGIGPAGFAPAGAAVAASQQIGLNQTDVFVVDNAGQLNVSWVDNAGAWSGPLGAGRHRSVRRASSLPERKSTPSCATPAA